jgi:energy-coupling factor transporter ATP-binding protein EcfA2
MSNKIKQYHKSTVTGLLGKNGDEKVKVITDIGLDVDAFKIGWVSGQFHHSQSSEWIQGFAEAKILIEANGNHKNGGVSYGCFGNKGYVFPLLGEGGAQENLFAFYPNSHNKQPEFLNNYGLFPRYPKAKTERLFILNDVISTASLIQSDALGNRDSVMSLFEGEAKKQHYTVVHVAEYLQEIIFIGVAESIIDTYKEEFPDLKISKVELPEGETMNDMLLTYDDGVEEYIYEKLVSIREGNLKMKTSVRLSAKQSELIEVNPQTHHFSSHLGLFRILGGLPNNLGDIRFKVKLENGNTYELRASDYSKLNAYKGWLKEKTSFDSSEIEDGVNELVNAVETAVEQIVNDYHSKKEAKAVALTPKAREKAVKTLTKSTDVLTDINGLVKQTGLVGEELNAYICFVISVSYKFNYQLHGIIQGKSGCGKSYLLKTILKCLPKFDTLDLTSVSSKAFNNSLSNQLHKKFIAFEDLSGVPSNAMYSLRESQSSDTINYMTVERDVYGRKDAVVNEVKTDYSSLTTTTQNKVYYDNQSRSILIGIDESSEQTDRITDYGNSVYRGEIDVKKQDEVRQQIANMIQVLESYEVVNPFAGRVILPKNADSYRRLTTQFNYVINVITLLNQFNRKKDKKDRLVVELQDVKQAIQIFYGCIKLKMDDLSNSERSFYENLKNAFPVQQGNEPKIYRKQVEQKLGLKKSMSSQYLKSLTIAGYLKAEGDANKGFHYAIVERDDYKSLTDDVLTQLYSQLESKVA